MSLLSGTDRVISVYQMCTSADKNHLILEKKKIVANDLLLRAEPIQVNDKRTKDLKCCIVTCQWRYIFLALLNPWVVRDSGRRVITTMTVTQRKGM
jgi:hypothetical protein